MKFHAYRGLKKSCAKSVYENKTKEVNQINLPKTAKQIKNSKDFIDIDGSVYTYRSNYRGIKTNTLIKKTQTTVHGYKYCGIYDSISGECKQKRIHRIVAETFIPNPNNLPVVGHKNNIKSDNRIENLYWTTYSENSQKAVNDGLLKNDNGYDDSQSKPVVMYETLTNKILGEYGSISEAVKQTGIPKTTIARQAKYHRPVRKPYYFRYKDDETACQNKIVGCFEYDTDKLISTHINAHAAAQATNTNQKIVAQQCLKGKPKTKHNNIYFKFVNSKCEQTIESKKRVE